MTSLDQKLIEVAREMGIPTKKLKDFIYFLKKGDPVENNHLLRQVGVSRNVLNQVKEKLQEFLDPSSKFTKLREDSVKEIGTLFDSDYKPEEKLFSILEDDLYFKNVNLLKKFKELRPVPLRNYDQFNATVETTARRAGLMDFFEDISEKNILFLGDDDFNSIAVANYRKAKEISVLDVDNRLLENIKLISKKENMNIKATEQDIRKSLPDYLTNKYDIVFTDPPYTPEGVKLFLSRAIEALNKSNNSARIYFCYGNSDKAKERFLPIYEIIISSGLMMRWVFDKFNRYNGAESIGNTSSLFVLDITEKTKPLIVGKYDGAIYTNN